MNTNAYIVTIWFVVATSITTAYLTPIQQLQIKRIIQHPETPIQIKTKVKKIVFIKYMPWIKKECQRFCSNNVDLLKYVYYNSIHKTIRYAYNKEDLYEDACIGFSKALQNFNGNCSTLTKYAAPYIKHEIYKGITIATMQSKIIEKQKNTSINTYKKPATERDMEIQEIKEIIKGLTPMQQKIMYYRYDPETLKQVRTINQVLEMIGISHETYRKNYKKIIQTISESKTPTIEHRKPNAKPKSRRRPNISNQKKQ